MQARKPIIASAAVVGAVAALLVATMVALETRWFSNYLSGKLSQSLGQPVTWRGPLQIDWSLAPTIKVEGLTVDSPDWTQHQHLAQVDSISARVGLPKLFRGLIDIEHLQLQRPQVHLAHSAEHGANWSFLQSEEEPDKDPLFKPRFGDILVSRGRLTYAQPAHETDLAASISSPDGEALRITGGGDLLGEALTIKLEGDPLQDVVQHEVDSTREPQSAYQVDGQIQWQDHQLQVSGATASLTALKDLQFEVSLAGPNAQELLQVWQLQATTSPYQLQVKLTHEQNAWHARNLQGQLGDSRFRADLTYQTDAQRPKIVAHAEISLLDVNQLQQNAQQQDERADALEEQTQPPQLRAHIHNALAPLRQYNADINLKVDHLQKGQTDVQNLHADLDLTDGELQLTAFEFDAGGGHAAASGTLNSTDKRTTADLSVRLQHLDLGAALTEFGLNYLATIDGVIEAQLQPQALIVNSQLSYTDDSAATALQIEARSDSDRPAEAFKLSADGKVAGEPAMLRLLGGPLLDLDDPEQAYPLQIDAEYAGNQLALEGTVRQPWRLAGADVAVHASGDNLGAMPQLAGGDASSEVQSFEFDAHLAGADESWQLRNITTQLGASDLSGHASWNKSSNQRWAVQADLQSQRLHIDQLTSLRAGQSENKAESDQQEQESDVLPEANIAGPLQAFDLRLNYHSKQVTYSSIPVEDMRLDAVLERGQLTLSPLSFGIGGGTAKFDLNADADASPMSGNLDIQLSQVNINELLAPYELANDSFGHLGGQGDFNFAGRSVAQALANLQGEMHLAMTGGKLDASLVEAVGLDAGEYLFSLFGDEPDPVDIQCAYVKLNANSGTVDVHPLTVATADSNISGKGQVNLEDESYELVIEAHPKDFSIGSAGSPIRIHGTFEDVQIDAVSDELIARGALAAIGAAVFPPAALLPLMTPGDHEGDRGCAQDSKSAESVAANGE